MQMTWQKSYAWWTCRRKCQQPVTLLQLSKRTASFLGRAFLTSVMPPHLLPEIGKLFPKIPMLSLSSLKTYRQSMVLPGKWHTLQEQLEWCERTCKARKIDIILGTSLTELEGQWNCVTTDLASANRDWRHDRVKLQQAIEAQLA